MNSIKRKLMDDGESYKSMKRVKTSAVAVLSTTRDEQNAIDRRSPRKSAIASYTHD